MAETCKILDRSGEDLGSFEGKVGTAGGWGIYTRLELRGARALVQGDPSIYSVSPTHRAVEDLRLRYFAAGRPINGKGVPGPLRKLAVFKLDRVLYAAYITFGAGAWTTVARACTEQTICDTAAICDLLGDAGASPSHPHHTQHAHLSLIPPHPIHPIPPFPRCRRAGSGLQASGVDGNSLDDIASKMAPQ